MPEASTALAQAVIYLATAPKSNAVYRAYGEAAAEATRDVAEPVPQHLRNAPTSLMKELGYGEGYRYAHDEPDAVAAMDCLPPRLQGMEYYRPTPRGYEKTVPSGSSDGRPSSDRAPPPTLPRTPIRRPSAPLPFPKLHVSDCGLSRCGKLLWKSVKRSGWA